MPAPTRKIVLYVAMFKRIDEWIAGRSRLALALVLVLLSGIAVQGLHQARVQEEERTWSRLGVFAELTLDWLLAEVEATGSSPCIGERALRDCDPWLERIGFPAGHSVAIVDRERILRGRHPSIPEAVGQVVEHPFLDAIVVGEGPARTRTRSPLDGGEAYFALASGTDHGLHAVVGVSVGTAMRPWRTALLLHLAGFAALFGLSVQLFRTHRRQELLQTRREEEAKELAELNQRLQEGVEARRVRVAAVRARVADAQFLAGISSTLVGAGRDEARAALRDAMEQAAEYFGAEGASLMVLGADQRESLALELVARGQGRDALEETKARLVDHFVRDLHLIRRHIEDRSSILLADTHAAEGPFPAERALLRSVKVSGALLLRISTRQGILGLVTLHRFGAPFALRDAEIALAELFASRLSEALRRTIEAERVQESARRFHLLFDSSDAVPIESVDASGRIVFWSAASARLYGHEAEEVMGRHLVDLLATEDARKRFRQWLAAASSDAPDAPGVPEQAQYVWRRPDGEEVEVLSQHVVFRPPRGSAEYYCVDTDVSELLRVQKRLHELATRDELTGLPNRAHFLAQARRELLRASRVHAPVALLLADLDHFKQINDRYGHQAGDAALRAVKQLFRRTLRAGDLVARIGGEEFAILLPLTGLDAARVTAERIRQGVEAMEVEHGGASFSLRVSVGIALHPADAEAGPDDVMTLLAAADRALYAAKRGGRNRCVVAGEVRASRSSAKKPPGRR